MKNKILIITLAILCIFIFSACDNTKTTTNPTNQNNSSSNIQTQQATPTPTEPNDPYTEIKVSSAKDIFQNVKPYTRIVLTESYYNISQIDTSSFDSQYATLENMYDGYEFIIHDIEHFEICSSPNVMAEIVTEASHVNVISLQNCKDVKINGIVAGHEVEKGSCTGGVISISDSSDIEINNCHLYGCGTYGIISNNCENVDVINTQIYECSYGLLDLYYSKNFNFSACSFRDSEEFTLINLQSCEELEFNNCTFTGNRAVESCSMISAGECSNITFNKCLFKDNSYSYFLSGEDVNMVACKIEDQDYEPYQYYDIAPDEDYEVNIEA